MEFTLMDILDSLAQRPQMFVGQASCSMVQSYLNGLSAGLRFAGTSYTQEEYRVAAQSRGWRIVSGLGIRGDFDEHGLSDTEMVRELVAVEIDAYRRAAARLKIELTRNIPTNQQSDRSSFSANGRNVWHSLSLTPAVPGSTRQREGHALPIVRLTRAH